MARNNKGEGHMDIPIIVPVMIVILFVIVINALIYVSLKSHIDSLESKMDECTLDGSVVKDDGTIDGDYYLTANTLTDEQMANLAQYKSNNTYLIQGITVKDVDYSMSSATTDIGIILFADNNALYIRPGDTIDVLGKFSSGPEINVYIKNARVTTVKFGNRTLSISLD